MKTNKEKEFIDPVTTPIIFWIIKSIGTGIITWITCLTLNFIRKKSKKPKTGVDTKKPKTGVDTNVEDNVS